MKKLLTVTGAILIAYVVLSSVYVSSGEEAVAAKTAQPQTRPQQIYVVREENDRLVVYLDEQVYLRTDTRVSTLPRSDRLKLEHGIDVFSDEELKQLLEDYCS